jgi:hypothetical protein
VLRAAFTGATQIEPIKSIKSIKPIKSVRNVPPTKPVYASTWSLLPLRVFLQSPEAAGAGAAGAFEATITNDFTGYATGRIFVLDNGQVWQQTEGWTWSWTWSRPRVLIYPTAGGWKLHFDQIDHDVYVQRVR